MEYHAKDCQWIGPGQDPEKGPVHMCGKPLFLRSYCEEHVWRVYQKGTSAGTKRKLKEMEREFDYIMSKEQETVDE